MNDIFYIAIVSIQESFCQLLNLSAKTYYAVIINIALNN